MPSMKLELFSLGQYLLIIIESRYLEVMKKLLLALKKCERTLVILHLYLLIGNYINSLQKSLPIPLYTILLNSHIEKYRKVFQMNVSSLNSIVSPFVLDSFILKCFNHIHLLDCYMIFTTFSLKACLKKQMQRLFKFLVCWKYFFCYQLISF